MVDVAYLGTLHRPFWRRQQTSRLRVLGELASVAVSNSGDLLSSSKAGTKRT